MNTVEICCATASCRAVFAIPTVMNARFIESGHPFYCPIGHQNVYTKTPPKNEEADKLRRELAEERSRRADSERSAIDARAAREAAKMELEAERNAVKGATKVDGTWTAVCAECHAEKPRRSKKASGAKLWLKLHMAEHEAEENAEATKDDSNGVGAVEVNP
jgi:hypothetical protein